MIKISHIVGASLLLTLAGISTSFAQKATMPTVGYQWSSVPVVGGGFVDGIICHPRVEGLRYCRTDMGGAYRWDNTQRQWVQLLDWLPEAEANLQGVESIALDTQHPERVYLACGTYTSQQGAILRSDDYGKTFQRTDVPIAMGGNENGRGNGERMMVDPMNGDVIYFGTRLSGLWRSTDRGVSWQQVTTFPSTAETTDSDPRAGYLGLSGCGVNGVLFVSDARADEAKGRTQTIYVSCSLREREAIYVSHDGGDTWSAVPRQPVGLRPTHMALASDGHIYISYADTPGPSAMTDGAVRKFNTRNGKWQDITPLRIGADGKAGFGYAAVNVDPRNARHIVATTHGLNARSGYYDEELFRSTDGGKTWKAVYKHGFEDDNTLAPYTSVAPLHWMFDIEIDPFNSDHAIFTTGFGGWETFNLSAVERKGEKVRWQIMSSGIEETVPLEFYCPPSGAHLLTGIGDYGGFTYFDPTQPVATGANHYPHFGNTDGVCGAWHKPQLMLRCGNIFNHLTPTAPIAYSEDGGRSWQACTNVPGEVKPGQHGEPEHGHVAMSAEGTTWVWTPQGQAPAFTTDKGATWATCAGLPANIKVVADKERDSVFYAVDVRQRMLYVSTDAARTFKPQPLALRPAPRMAQGHGDQPRGDSRGGQDRVYPIPGESGKLWLAAYDGLYFVDATAALSSPMAGVSTTQQCHVTTIIGFGLGKAATGASHPTLYVVGVVDGQYGIFRSTDNALTWQRINDDAHQYGKLLHIAGDMQVFGRVYVGTHGRGTIMGEAAE